MPDGFPYFPRILPHFPSRPLARVFCDIDVDIDIVRTVDIDMPIDIDADIDMYSWQPNNGKYDTSRDSYTHTHIHTWQPNNGKYDTSRGVSVVLGKCFH